MLDFLHASDEFRQLGILGRRDWNGVSALTDDVGDNPIPPGNEHLVRKIQRPDVTVQEQLLTYNPTEFKWDSKGNLEEIIDAKGNSTVMTYTADGMVDSITDRNGHKTEFVYEGVAFDGGHRRLQEIKVPKGTQVSDGFRKVTFGYTDADNPFNVTTVTDDLSNTVTTEYDIMDRITKVTDALGNETEYVYEDGLLTTVKLPPNQASGSTAREVSMVHDIAGRVTEILRNIDSSNQQTRVKYEYSAYGEVTKMIRIKDSVEKSFKFGYDRTGRRVMTIDSLENLHYTAWEKACEGHARTSARGIRHHHGIDLMCRPTVIDTGESTFDILEDYDDQGPYTKEEYIVLQLSPLGGEQDQDYFDLDTKREVRKFFYDELGRMVRSLQGRSFYGQALYGPDNRYAEVRLIDNIELCSRPF
jgi:YD repeat-containing protein